VVSVTEESAGFADSQIPSRRSASHYDIYGMGRYRSYSLSSLAISSLTMLFPSVESRSCVISAPQIWAHSSTAESRSVRVGRTR
jgi:heme exporter protein D